MDEQAKEQIRSEVFRILVRYTMESDANDEDIAQSAMNAINDFLGDELIELTED
jgi:hypothetical protein